MTGTLTSGEKTAKDHPEPRAYKGRLADDEARRLRRVLLNSLKRGHYTAAQIEQITGWAGRTIRRDLAVGVGPEEQLFEVVEDFEVPEPQGRAAAPGQARRMTRAEQADIMAEYSRVGESNPEVASFLQEHCA